HPRHLEFRSCPAARSFRGPPCLCGSDGSARTARLSGADAGRLRLLKSVLGRFRLSVSGAFATLGNVRTIVSHDLPMKSPCPGMDPYIEDCGLWGDFHFSLISAIKRALARTVPARYIVRAEERSYLVLIESEGKVSHPFLPDVSVTTTEGRKKTPRK